jgi:uncharacterized protein (DUF2267 family)
MVKNDTIIDFDSYATKGLELLNTLADDMKIPRDKAGRILRAVLYAIRSRISLDESLQVIAQLPMALKAIYVDQWDPWHSFHRIQRLDEFVKDVRRPDKGTRDNDIPSDDHARLAIGAVFRTFNHHLSPGEFRNIAAVLPRAVKDFVNSRVEDKAYRDET